MLSVYRIDPLEDSRWVRLVNEHPGASIFHTPGWLRALKRTYGYEPVGFTTSRPGSQLTNAVVFCHIKSWVTGSRIVSLPFSDHCELLTDGPASSGALFSALQQEVRGRRCKSVELRPLASSSLVCESGDLFVESKEFHIHRLDLRPSAASLFRGFHKSCVQRKIRRAEREKLTCESGRSPALLKRFYRLLVLTRRRHQLPPQPFAWFQNLVECLGDRLTIRLASINNAPVASILTLAHRTSMVYKYGCSDERLHNLGGVPLLFWMAIQEAKDSGFLEFDLGRSDLHNDGLVQFKDHLGAAGSRLVYYRSPQQADASRLTNWGSRVARQIFSRVPGSVLVPAGKLLYRHLG